VANEKEALTMLRKRCLLAHTFSLLIATHLYGQGPPKTPEQFLTQAGISLDKNSLIQALDDNRVGILASAATVLAERGITEAVPAIDSRMKGEQNKQLVLTLAQSLNILGSSDGTKQLEAFCLGKDVDGGERMRAAYALVNTKNYSCLPAMPEFLNSSHPDDKQSALLYLLQIPSPQKNAPKTLGPALLAIASSDTDKQFRTLAKRVIERIGDPATKGPTTAP
jgi:HEAT repeat protein